MIGCCRSFIFIQLKWECVNFLLCICKSLLISFQSSLWVQSNEWCIRFLRRHSRHRGDHRQVWIRFYKGSHQLRCIRWNASCTDQRHSSQPWRRVQLCKAKDTSSRLVGDGAITNVLKIQITTVNKTHLQFFIFFLMHVKAERSCNWRRASWGSLTTDFCNTH